MIGQAHLNPETGQVICIACKSAIEFLPVDHMPESGPYSVNHTGCPLADPKASPAGANIDGLYETINVIDRKEVEAFYKAKRPDAYKRAQATAKAVAAAAAPVDATPGAVAHAEATGVDLNQVEGTGQGGRITKSDVTDAAASS